VLLERRDPSCLDALKESMRLGAEMGDSILEAEAALPLSHAYDVVVEVRDLSEAERWAARAFELRSDPMARVTALMQLGSVAQSQFWAMDADAEPDTRREALQRAASYYSKALSSTPENAIRVLAVIHHQLGAILALFDTDAAVEHYSHSIRYEEKQQNTFGAGQTRASIARLLAKRDPEKALIYARAAQRDFERIGAATPLRDHMDRLIDRLERER
jgi:hypothetical protein